MSISTFSELKTALASWIHRSDLTSVIPDAITMAEAKFNRRLRVKEMEAALSATSLSSGLITRPSDLVAVKALWNTDADKTPVKAQSLAFVLENRMSGLYITNLPQSLADYYAWDRTYFRFNVDNGEVEGVYFESIDALSDANTTNWLLTAAPDLYLAASLAELYQYALEEDRATWWTTKANALIDEMNRNDARDKYSGQPLAVSIGR